MVQIIATAVRENNDGESYVALKLQGEIEMVLSQTGRFYATARTSWMSSTFSEQVAESLVGSKIPGRIVKQDVDPYEFTLPDTGEVITLSHKWVYKAEEEPKPLSSRPTITMRKAEESLNGIPELV